VTSALDPISEGEVMSALEALMKGRTTFVIAHRLHTLTNIQCVYVLKDGKIVDRGTQQVQNLLLINSRVRTRVRVGLLSAS
jgi:ABC-type multidrug transport system fused ATPase/permease subunit